MRNNVARRPVVMAGLLLGIGFGGFVDGILLHQVLQWHHMLTSAGFPPTTVGSLEINTLWDGLFHSFTWVLSLIGLVLLWRTGRRPDVAWSGRVLAGGMLAGWGLFNLVEGLVDHHILGIHHVNEVAPASQWIYWDLGFLALGATLLGFGWALAASAHAAQTGAARSDETRRVA